MNKSKYEPSEYFALYNAALAAYADTLLGANKLMLEYTVAATRTMLGTAIFAAPVAPAKAPEAAETQAMVAESIVAEPDASASIEAEPVVSEPIVTEPIVTEPITSEPSNDSFEAHASPRANKLRKGDVRRRFGKK